MHSQSRPSTDYIGFVEPAGHRNVVRAETVTIMRKMVDGSYNLHISGYSYAKTTNDLQVRANLQQQCHNPRHLASLFPRFPRCGRGVMVRK